jgi:hypothetical protein
MRNASQDVLEKAAGPPFRWKHEIIRACIVAPGAPAAIISLLDGANFQNFP